MDSDNAIALHGLTKWYGRVPAVAGLSLEIARGEIFGFLGPNGAGKTTSVKMIVGLARPSAGSGSVLGRPIGDRRARRRIGYLPELFRYQEWLSAREVLRLHARLCGVRRPENAIADALRLVGLEARADSRVAEYSKGMQQRLGLAVALLGDPELIVLDEPTSALDPIGRHDVREIVRGLRARGTTVFLNSHLLGEIEQVCDRVAIVTRGRAIAQGSIAEIVGRTNAVRLRARANGTPIEPLLARFGEVRANGGEYTVAGAGPEDVPHITRVLVEADAQVLAIEPLAATLEERFLEIAGEQS